MELSHFIRVAAVIAAAIWALSYMSNQPISASGASAIASSFDWQKRGSTQSGRRSSTRGRLRPDRPVKGVDRKSVVWGTRVSVRVALGGSRIITKQKQPHN